MQIAFRIDSPAAVGLHWCDAMTRSTWRIVPVLAVFSVFPAHLTSQVEHDPYRIASFCLPEGPGDRPPITVTNGAGLQQALDRAVGGDTILLAPGATFRPSAPEGSFMLRNRQIPAGQWVIVRSASRAFDAGGEIPATTRVDRSNQNLMPKIRATATNTAAIRAEAGARGYRLIGLDIGIDPAITQLTNLVELGSDTHTAIEAVSRRRS